MESDQPTIFAGLVAVLLLVLANAFFVAAEFALVGARRTRLDEMAKAGDGKARLARRAVQSLDRYISATQLGITLASLGLGWVGEPALAHLIEGGFVWLPATAARVATHGLAVAIAFTIITVLHIILGELVPKAFALLYPEEVSSWLALPLMGFAWVMALPIWILNGTANGILRLAHIKRRSDHDRLHSPEEIRLLVEQSQEAGSLQREDARLLEGVFEFTEKTAEEVMTPRTEIVALEADLTIRQAADRAVEAQRSRFPVFTESLDDIIGVVHAKAILSALITSPDSELRSIARPPLFVPGTREVEDVLTDMKKLKVHLAVVLDEYGGTAGLVTMEDLLEEIVGPIFDEYDRPDHQPGDEGGTVIDGSMTISQFNTDNDASLDDTAYTTVGGLLFGQLGRLPKPGDLVTVDGFEFEIRSMAGRRVDRVRVIGRIKPVDPEASEA